MDREQLRRLRGVASTARSCIECGWHGARGGASTARSSIDREKPARPAGLTGLAGLAAPAGLAGLPGLAALAALAGLAGQQNDARTLATAMFWRGGFEIPSYSLIITTFLDFAHEAVLSGRPRGVAEAPWELFRTYWLSLEICAKVATRGPRMGLELPPQLTETLEACLKS